MTARKSAAATLVASVQPAVAEYNRTDAIKRLADANAQQRVLILSALPMGEVAAIGGIVGTMATSVNEVLNIKMCDKHGTDWAVIYKTVTANLSDADKTRKKAIHASLEGIRETVQANSGGNKDKARDIIRRVKEWGEGKRNNKLSNPKGNTKLPIVEYLLSWDVLPSMYRRLCKDEGTEEREMLLADAIAAYFEANKINAKAVLASTGKAAWEAA
jgi:hypothetical protein